VISLARTLCTLLLALAPLAAAAQQITVSAAASLADALREIGSRFEAARPGSTVRFNFAASGVLVQQIIQGAPADVFASADAETMDRGIAQKVIDAATRREFAANTLVMVVPAQGALPLTQLTDLTGPAVRRIAVGKPASVPVGRYTREALDRARLWPALEPKFVFADSVRQALDYVARGEAEAGFVYRTDAQTQAGRVRVVLTVSGHAPITYPAAVVTDTRQPALARAFVEFLTGAEAQAILARFGFGKP
jgi:molybdate transport system substrate-binding protein